LLDRRPILPLQGREARRRRGAAAARWAVERRTAGNSARHIRLVPFNKAAAGRHRRVLRLVSSDKKKARQKLRFWRAWQCRGDWIRTSDLLNPILGVEAASSRRIPQVQAF
jgi:hypothetical protein